MKRAIPEGPVDNRAMSAMRHPRCFPFTGLLMSRALFKPPSDNRTFALRVASPGNTWMNLNATVKPPSEGMLTMTVTFVQTVTKRSFWPSLFAFRA